MRNYSRWLKLGLAAVALGGLAFTGVYLVQHFWPSTAKTLLAGESALAKGAGALAEKDGMAALASFDEAKAKANQIFEGLAKKREKDVELTPEQQEQDRQLEGAAYWLKFRALRDEAYAKALVDGKPLAETEDAAAKERFRDLNQIRDPEARKECVIALREAVLRLPDSRDVQKEGLRFEMSLEPPQWPLIALTANNLLRLTDPTQRQIDASDLNTRNRALYILAKYEYEQPPPASSSGPGKPLVSVPEKRNVARMLKAREHITELKKLERPLRWRASYLDGLLDQWFIQYYRQPGKRGPELEQEEARLRAMLFDPAAGALKTAAADPALGRSMSRMDIEGVLGLHTLALETILADSRRRGAETDRTWAEQALQTLQATTALCQRLLAEPSAGAVRVGDVGDQLLAAAQRIQPLVSQALPDEWNQEVEALKTLARSVADKNAGTPYFYARLVQILTAQAELEGKRGQSSRQVELQKEALDFVEAGLRIGQAKNLQPATMASLHEAAVRLKALTTGKREDLEPHLEILKRSNLASAQGTAHLIEGAFAEREGRLERARDLLEKALTAKDASIVFRAQMVLANVYVALGDYDKALTMVRNLESAFERFEQLAVEDRTWAAEYLPSPQSLTLLQIKCRLGLALQQQRQLRQSAAAKTASSPLTRSVAAHEAEVQRLVKKLPARSPLDRDARQNLVAYYAESGQASLAEQELGALQREYQDSVDVLRLELAIRAGQARQDKAAIAQADERIKQFLARNSENDSGKLLWAEWLGNTGRAREAVAYLDNPVNFKSTEEGQRNRARAVALLSARDQERGLDLLRYLPRDQGVEALLIRHANLTEDLKKQQGEALTRYEALGLEHCYNAQQSLRRGDYAEAAAGFLKALEFTRIKSVAQQGLMAALLSLAAENPVKVREMATEMLQLYPSEPAVLVPYAQACLLLDDLGDANDRSGQIKNMATALNAVEASLVQQRSDAATGPLLKAQFWHQAGKTAQARAELRRVLEKNPKHEPALSLAARIALDSHDPIQLAQALAHLKVLRQVNPDAAEPMLLEAQIHAREGKQGNAINAYQDLLVKHPLATAGYLGLLELLHERGDKDWLGEWADYWRARNPNDPLAAQAKVRHLCLIGKGAQARSFAESFLAEQLKRADKQLASSDKADPAEADKLKQSALDELERTLSVILGNGFIQGRSWSEAEAWAKKLAERFADAEAAHLLLGDVFMERLRDENDPTRRAALAQQAQDAYTEVYKNRKGHYLAGNNLAWLLAKELHNPEEALRIAREVRTGRFSQTLLPGDRLSLELLDTFGVIFRALDRADYYAEMRDLFEAAVQRYPADPRMHLYLGHARMGLKEIAKAKESFATAAQLAGPRGKSLLSPAQKKSVFEEAQAAQKRLSAMVQK